MTIVIYQKPTCTTCRQVHAALVESGVDFDAVDYYVDPIPKKKLLDLLRKMRIRRVRSSRVPRSDSKKSFRYRVRLELDLSTSGFRVSDSVRVNIERINDCCIGGDRWVSTC